MATGTRKKPKPPTERQYEEAEAIVAFSFAPEIEPCRKCEWPRGVGYSCRYCGTSNPDTPDEEPT